MQTENRTATFSFVESANDVWTCQLSDKRRWSSRSMQAVRDWALSAAPQDSTRIFASFERARVAVEALRAAGLYR